jgi:PAS domain S-box-containing protein
MAVPLLSTYLKPYVRAWVGRSKQVDLQYHLAMQDPRDIVLLTRVDDGRIVGANRQAIGAYGYSRRELLQLTLYSLNSFDAQTTVPRHSSRNRTHPVSKTIQTLQRRRDGSTFPAEVDSTYINLLGRELLLSRIHNTTPSPLFTQPLQQSDEIYTQLVNSSKEATDEGLEHNLMDQLVRHESTLIAWAHTLELREAEPPGHCQRVTELTEQLAIAMGVPAHQLIHIRHGALLHDIGKMRIPDSILRKPGPLNKEEWEIVRRHPEYAYQMLGAISFLRAALDIPYCHHERWDGTGYPRGLSDTQIPLAARIFAVVDVWDTLRSDRPFRKALPDGEAMAYVMELSGSHFDPAVISVFYSLFKGVQFHLPLQQPAFGIL